MKRFYLAIRGRVTSPGPARPVFRSNTDMLLLTTRLRLDGDGKPHVPGDLSVWQNLFIKPPRGKYDAKLTRSASGWKEPDDVLEALLGRSPQECGKRAAQGFPGVDRRQPQSDATARSGHCGSSGARVPTDGRAVLSLQRGVISQRQDDSPVS